MCCELELVQISKALPAKAIGHVDHGGQYRKLHRQEITETNIYCEWWEMYSKVKNPPLSKYADLYDLRNRITKRLVCHVSFWGREQYYFKNLLGPGVWYTGQGMGWRAGAAAFTPAAGDPLWNFASPSVKWEHDSHHISWLKGFNKTTE